MIKSRKNKERKVNKKLKKKEMKK